MTAPENQGRPEPVSQPKQPARKPATTKTPGSAFVPDLNSERVAVESARWYWVGALFDCPTDSLDFAGVNFPKTNEIISKGRDGQQQRIPVIGALVKLHKEQFDQLREQISRTVIRFVKPKPAGERLIKQDVANKKDPPRKGEAVRIPRPSEIEERRKGNFVVVHYEPSPLDEPAADYIFAQLCEDQDRGNRGSYTPPPLSETGLLWPEAAAVA